MKNPNPFKDGEHLVKCDICDRQVYFPSQAKYRWDGVLCCTKYNCWDEKHGIFEQIPVINDPEPIYDVRPDQTAGTETYVSPLSGGESKFGGPQFGQGSYAGRVKFGAWHVKFGNTGAPPSYI